MLNLGVGKNMIYKKTKIVCTIGPSSWDKETLKELALSGMDLARLNLSHGTHEEKRDQINRIRSVAKEIGKRIAIIADLQGPKLRLGEIDGVLTICEGDILKFSITPGKDILPIQFDFAPFIKRGQRIFLNDGLIELIVLGNSKKIVKAQAQNSGWISSNKGINLPDTYLNSAAFTPKDKIDAEFAIKEKVDYLALSYVQTASDINVVKNLIKESNSKTKIIAKIEKNEAILNLEEIIKAADALIVARGDLGIETKAEEVPLLQQKIVKLSRQHQKPVIVATQMLESMVENPRPTRAEVSDVANAVLDQVDGVMLSAESASGKYPIQAVKIMRDVILSVEKNSEYKKYIKINWENIHLDNLSVSAIASSAASLAYRIDAKAIITATSSGRTVRFLASFRPNAQILAVAHDEQTCDQLGLIWGVTSMPMKPIRNSDKFWRNIIKEAKAKGLVNTGEKIVLVGGTKIGTPGATDSIKVVTL